MSGVAWLALGIAVFALALLACSAWAYLNDDESALSWCLVALAMVPANVALGMTRAINHWFTWRYR